MYEHSRGMDQLPGISAGCSLAFRSISTNPVGTSYDGKMLNGVTISAWVVELGLWPLIIVLLPNLLFRRYGQGTGKKRWASLLQAIAVFLITSMAGLVLNFGLKDYHFLSGVFLVLVALFVFREKVFPYRLSCVSCNARLDFQTIYFRDDNLCLSCRSAQDESEKLNTDGAEDTDDALEATDDALEATDDAAASESTEPTDEDLKE